MASIKLLYYTSFLKFLKITPVTILISQLKNTYNSTGEINSLPQYFLNKINFKRLKFHLWKLTKHSSFAIFPMIWYSLASPPFCSTNCTVNSEHVKYLLCFNMLNTLLCFFTVKCYIIYFERKISFVSALY